MSAKIDGLDVFIKNGTDNLRGLVVDTIDPMVTDIVKQTPVDTGRLKNSWNVSKNKRNEKANIIEDKDGNRSIAMLKNTLGAFKLGDVIYVSNPTEYGYYIEYLGHSAKAPNGMLRVNLLRFKQYVKRAKRIQK